MTHTLDVPPGLAGVIVTDTGLSDVRGREGFYHYRQYSAVELAQRRTLEDVWCLLLDGSLPDPPQRAAFTTEVTPLRRIPEPVAPLLAPVARAGGDPLAQLRTALSLVAAARVARPLYDLDPVERRTDALAASAVTPTLLAALHRLRHGKQPVAPRDDLSHAANYLYMITGAEPDPAYARALEQYLILTVEHGFNASTFTARVITSTGADLASSLCGALGALSGPRHGGAPSRALDTVDEIGSPERTDAVIRRKVRAGERIMGFGHPVYRTEDPRSALLREIAVTLGGDLADLAVQVEQQVLAVLAELKPERELHTNVEFYAAVVMQQCGLPREMFTPTFAASRVIGWCANILEQANDSKIIRPAARYTGVPAPTSVPDPSGAGPA